MKVDGRKQVGLMCGTFDPPHLGHLILAETAARQIPLDEVLFLPVGQPPHKQEVTAAQHRVAMTTHAIADNPDFSLNTTDVERPAPHYTADLIPILHQQYPDAQFWFIMGGDSLATLATWERASVLIEMCKLAVLERPGEVIDWEALEKTLPEVRSAVRLLSGLSMHISSTQIRQDLAASSRLRYVLPESVQLYIAEQGLYQAS